MGYHIVTVAINKHNPDLEAQIKEHGFVDNVIVEEGKDKKALCTFRVTLTTVMAVDNKMNPMTESEFHEILDKVIDDVELISSMKSFPFTPFTKKDLDDLLKRIAGVR